MMSSPTARPAIEGRIDAWVRAELAGDSDALSGLLHPDFLGVGPFGFLLDRGQWIGRFAAGLRYTAFSFTPDVPPRSVGAAIVVVGTQRQRGDHQSQPLDAEFRATLLLAPGPDQLLTGIHLSPRYPPRTGRLPTDPS